MNVKLLWQDIFDWQTAVLKSAQQPVAAETAARQLARASSEVKTLYEQKTRRLIIRLSLDSRLTDQILNLPFCPAMEESAFQSLPLYLLHNVTHGAKNLSFS